MSFTRRLLSLILSGVAPALAEESLQPSRLSPPPLFAATDGAVKPAVDGLNGKVQLYGGAGQANALTISGIPGLSPLETSPVWKGIGGATGTLTVPISHSIGAQLDLSSGVFGNAPLGAAGGHFFWRDPDKGMIGAYGSGLILGDRAGRAVWTSAGEFEAYLGRITGRAILGVQGATAYSGGATAFQQFGYGVNTAGDSATYFHDIVEATFYPVDDLALTVGHMYSFGRNAVTGEVEYLLPQFRGGNIAPSAFLSATYGWNNASNIMAGVRVYFGNHDKSLIRRQREDDPKVQNNHIFSVSGSCSSGVCNGGRAGLLNGTGGPGAILSDFRLKRDIVLLEHRDDGLGIYSYRYLWSDTTYVGVMAQEVLQMYPEAVITTAPDGYLRVNYALLGMQLMTLEAWELSQKKIAA